MKNYVSSGVTLDLTAPSGGVVSCKAVKIGSAIVIPRVDAAEGTVFAGDTLGVFDVDAATHATDQAWTEGLAIYWDNTAKKFTVTASGNTKAGYAVAAKVSTVGTGRIRLVPTI